MEKRSSFHVRFVDDPRNHLKSTLESNRFPMANRDVVGLILADRYHESGHSSLHFLIA